MRILNIIASVDPETGGPLEGLRLGAEVMHRWGHQTEVVSLDDPAAPFVKAFAFPVHACGPGRFRGGFAPGLVPWIRRNAHRFDAAVVHGLWNWASIGGWRGLRRAGLPYVLFAHGMMDPWFRDTYPAKHRLKQAVWFMAQGRVLRDAAAVLFTCEEEQRLARGAFTGHRYRGKVVTYGIAEPPPPSIAQATAFRKNVPALDDRRYLLFLSRLHRKKGCDLLVEAFASIANRHPDVDLVMAGPDQDGLRSDLQALAARQGLSSRIHWPGMLRGDAKWGAFRSADAFILPSHQENFGIAVAEAMACGKPVLISNRINIWRAVKACGGGLVDGDTKDGILRMLETWLAMPEAERLVMSLGARRGFEQSFGIEQAAQSLLGVLQEARKKCRSA